MPAKPSHRALIILDLGVFNLFVACLYRLLGWQVFYFRRAKTNGPAYRNKLACLLKLVQLDFQTIDSADLSYIYGDLHDTARKTVDRFWSHEITMFLTRLVPQVTRLDQKLYIINRSFIDHRCRDLAAVATWAVGQTTISVVRVLTSICSIRKEYLREVDFDIAPALFSRLYFAGELASICANKLAKSPKSRSSEAAHKILKAVPGDVTGLAEYSNEILYFPHKTIAYGRAFLKDHFYSESRDSPFLPKNIMHVELEPIAQTYITPELCKIYEHREIQYCVLPTNSGKTLLHYLPRLLRNVRVRELRLLLSGSRVLLFISAYFYVQYESYRNSLRRFPNATIALVGYEMLFPKALALALESKGIVTVASQERLVPSTFYRNYNYIVDTFFTGSAFVCEQLRQSKEKYVERCIPVGLVRTDLLVSLATNKGRVSTLRQHLDGRKLIVAYDFDSLTKESENAKQVVVNWRANNQFYQDLIRLAETFSDVHIIVRGKNAKWLALPYFADTIAKLDACANIQVSADYSRMGIQYELAAAADFVIAKHSSIGDECLAIGKQVIFYDYLPNANSLVSRAFNYGGIPVFAYSYEDLRRSVSTFIEKGVVLGASEIEKVQEIVNGGCADGLVRGRIQTGLEGIYREQQAGVEKTNGTKP